MEYGKVSSSDFGCIIEYTSEGISLSKDADSSKFFSSANHWLTQWDENAV